MVISRLICSSWSRGLGLCLALVTTTVCGQDWKLIGLTGQSGDEADNLTLVEIDTGTAAVTPVLKVNPVADTNSIGYNPQDKLIYHAGGGESWTNDPARSGGAGFQDNHYLETVNLASETFSAIYNANACPNPDPALPCFGLDAPRPSFVEPLERRNSTQTDGAFRVRGVNEPHAFRNLAWNPTENVFYGTDEQGLFRLTPEGESTFVAKPAYPVGNGGTRDNDAKGIAFVTVGDATKMFVGDRNDDSSPDTYLWEVEPETGIVLDTIELAYPEGGALPVDSFGGLLAIAQHPQTGVVYGVRKTGETVERELVTIDVTSGATTLVGTLFSHVASMVFAEIGANPCDLNSDGAVDAADAGIMFGDWGGPGSTSPADKNEDGFVDAADAGVMFAAWTGDPNPPGDKAATAEYNAETGELKISSAGAVNVFVQSASNSIVPISPPPTVPVGLLTNNAGRVGITNLGPINVSNFSFGNIGKGLAMSDLKLVYTTALGTKGIEVPASGSDSALFKYIPEPATGILGIVAAWALLGVRRKG